MFRRNEIEEENKTEEKEYDNIDEAIEEDLKQFNWFGMLVKLAQNDITKFDLVGKQNWITALNLLTYWHLINKIEEENLKKQKYK